jgi:hypothetical protein
MFWLIHCVMSSVFVNIEISYHLSGYSRYLQISVCLKNIYRKSRNIVTRTKWSTVWKVNVMVSVVLKMN